MHAMLVDDRRQLVWTPVADPAPLADQVVIRIRAAGVNRADLLQRAGHYPSPPGWPDWMGLEVAGDIIHAPPVGRWRVGDRVCALLGGGGYAEQVAAPADMVLPIPQGLSYEEAAGIPEAFATAWLNLCMEGDMQAGQTVFIQAGASGVGMAAIQLARFLDAKVVTTVGSQAKADFVRQLGAAVVIDHKREDVAAVLASHPVDVALDCVAGPQLGRCLATMAPGGRWIIIATLGGQAATLDMNDFFRRGVRLIGSTLRSRSTATKAALLAQLEKQLWRAFSDGQLRSVIHATLPITQAQEAHDMLRCNENLGKVVLAVQSSGK